MRRDIDIEDLGAQLDAACSEASVPKSGLERRTARSQSVPIRLLYFLLWLITAGILLTMLLRMLPNSLDGKRYIPIIVSLVPWLGVCSALIAVIAALGKRIILTAVSIVCVVLQLFWHWGFLMPRHEISETAQNVVSAATGSLPNTSDRYARIMTFNTKEGKADAAQIVETVRTEHVEVLAMQEVTWDLINRLKTAGIASYLPYSNIAQQTWHDNGGVNVLFSAAPMENATADLIPVESSSIPASTIDFGGKKVRFGSVHPFSPRPRNQGLWNKSLDSIAQLRRYDNGASYVLMGDFNSTWDHASFRYLLGSRFVDSGEQSGEGFHMTYPAVFPIAEIDHIVHDRDIHVGDLETKRIDGSDHLALLGTLEVCDS